MKQERDEMIEAEELIVPYGKCRTRWNQRLPISVT
jgi:hypothetical protein